jgi:uncharacterized RDD family membrane protein YckC
MSRWRDIKQGGAKKNIPPIKEEENTLPSAPLPERIKAFVVDMFMIMMPLAYLTTYIFLDGKDEFQDSNEARWAISIIFGVVVILFWIIKGQTPGYKAYSVKLVDNKTLKNISFFKAILRYFIFLLAGTTIVLAFIPFFRKDKKTIQDLLTKSTVILETK